MILAFTGQPLSGKTTVAEELAKRKGYGFFSTGDYARFLGIQVVEPSIRRIGLSLKLNDAINDMVEYKCRQHSNIVLDGYPRSVEQVLLLQSLPSRLYVFFLFVNPVIAKSRMDDRGREDDDWAIINDRSEAAVRMCENLRRVVDLQPFFFEGTVEQAVTEVEQWLDEQ